MLAAEVVVNEVQGVLMVFPGPVPSGAKLYVDTQHNFETTFGTEDVGFDEFTVIVP